MNYKIAVYIFYNTKTFNQSTFKERLTLNQETTLQNVLNVKLYIVIKHSTTKKTFIRWKLEISGKYSCVLKYPKIQNYINNMYPYKV